MALESLTLLSNASADGTAQKVKFGGRYIWGVEGTFNSGSWKLQATGPNGTYIDIDGATLSANGFLEIEIAPGVSVKAVKSGSPSATYSTLTKVPEQ